jgi:hypothetical protein
MVRKAASSSGCNAATLAGRRDGVVRAVAA